MASMTSSAPEIRADAVQDDGPTRLIETNDPRIIRYSARGRDPATADDVAQGARLRLWKWARAHGKNRCSTALVRRAVRSAAVEQVRDAKRIPGAVDSIEARGVDEAHAHLVAVEASGPDVIAKKLVGAWLATLPLKLRAVFCGIYRRDLTQREIARRMRVTQARVSQLHGELLRLGRAKFGAPSA